MKHIYYWLGHGSYKLSELFGDLYQYFMDKHGRWQDPETNKHNKPDDILNLFVTKYNIHISNHGTVPQGTVGERFEWYENLMHALKEVYETR